MFEQLALWTWPGAITTENPQRLVDRVKAAGIDIIIPYISKRGGTVEDKMMHTDYEDKLRAIITETHRQGLKIHGCFDEMNVSCAMPEAVQALTQMRQDGSAGKVLCPANPAAREYVLSELRRTLTDFEYDGINLEDGYIYNPNTIYDPAHQVGDQFRTVAVCYCDYCRKHAPIEQRSWADWRREALTKLIVDLRQLTKELRPGIPFSAAARMPYQRSFYEPYAKDVPYMDGWKFCQSRDGMMSDWVEWHRRGAMDFVCPMSYFHDTRIVELETLECRQIMPDPDNNVWIGLALGVCSAEYMFGSTKKDPAYLIDAKKLREQLTLVNKLGHRNAVFFSYGGMTDEHIPVLAEFRRGAK